MFKYLDGSNIADKSEFSKLIRAELSTAELSLLAANGLTPRGKNFKLFIEKYHLLEHLPRKLAIDPAKFFRKVYHPAAFNEKIPYPDAATRDSLWAWIKKEAACWWQCLRLIF